MGNVKTLDIPMTAELSRHLLHKAIQENTGVGEIVGKILEEYWEKQKKQDVASKKNYNNRLRKIEAQQSVRRLPPEEGFYVIIVYVIGAILSWWWAIDLLTTFPLLAVCLSVGASVIAGFLCIFDALTGQIGVNKQISNAYFDFDRMLNRYIRQLNGIPFLSRKYFKVISRLRGSLESYERIIVLFIVSIVVSVMLLVSVL